MFKTRLLSGILLVLLAIALIIPGGWFLFIATLVISIIGYFELMRVFQLEKTWLARVGYLFIILYFLLMVPGLMGMTAFDILLRNTLNLTVIMSFIIILMAMLVFRYPKFQPEDIMKTFFGFFYVAVMLSFVFLIRQQTGGVFFVWLIFICSWGCDTSAYCVGMLFGKRKLAPVLSPKKSVEGAIGGVAGAGLIAVLYALALNQWSYVHVSLITFAVIGMIGGGISQIGDLAASGIKRFYDIKDYGRLIPGHGGILDRFDSVIFTAPIIYFLVLFFM